VLLGRVGGCRSPYSLRGPGDREGR
jgi:hypothetical protein